MKTPLLILFMAVLGSAMAQNAPADPYASLCRDCNTMRPGDSFTTPPTSSAQTVPSTNHKTPHGFLKKKMIKIHKYETYNFNYHPWFNVYNRMVAKQREYTLP